MKNLFVDFIEMVAGCFVIVIVGFSFFVGYPLLLMATFCGIPYLIAFLFHYYGAITEAQMSDVFFTSLAIWWVILSLIYFKIKKS